ncbi:MULTISPECIES: DUF2124 domain-containing protein [Methanoculleus]|uniref:DUF2124 domain-containing protein n=2 Tax=Methanoculleus TaxID=45989 RepID=A3CXK6_METMJ|nr:MULTISPECIES: DUF2124 domain-containing protein [Methanoculleus]ABN58106.1 conserved hypothetical protein [Methanoculleus marisnigri JR1]MCC7554770.1 DUF2124 domain-containing protein [Methanoculleus marisnigri]UYU19488.1 DUF2124 domain-containing protein [Methanoculleus submarinus]
MELKEQLSGVPGMLRPFKAYLKEAGLEEGDQVVYYGCPGTCTPFIELLGFAVRDLPLEQVYVPYVDEAAAKTVRPVEGVGMQVSGDAVSLDPKVIVLMGGLAMPGVPVEKEAVQSVVAAHPGAKVVGICFMQMFEKMGWLDALDFDLIIDAAIDPVKVWR